MLRSRFLWMFIEFRSWVSEEKSKMSPPIRGQGGHLVFLIDLKNTNLVGGFEILLPVKFRWIPFSGFRGEVKMSQPIRGQGGHLVFSDRPEKHKLGGRQLRSCFLSSVVEFRSAVSEKKSKISQPISCWGGHLVFLIGPKSQTWWKAVEILLPVKFRWIPFSRFRGEVVNFSANQRQGWPSCFSDQPEKHKLGRRQLRSCFLSSCFVDFRLAISEEKSTIWRRTDGRQTVRYDNSSLEPSVQVS